MVKRSRVVRYLCVLELLAVCVPERAQSTWHGFERNDLAVDGRKCIVVAPETPAEGKPWIWRARFFGHEPQTDITLLEKGFHLAYMDVSNMFGSPTAVAHWDAFYEYLTDDRGLSKKVALEGMSRGGLIIYNWAAKNPDKVACIYADAPVCDFKSWPGGKGKGKASAGDWQRCLEAYGLTEAQALEYNRNPIDNLQPLAKHKVPILHICGDADKVVPIDENTRILEKRYKALGGDIIVLGKPGVGHHPHSFKDPAQIVNFVLKHTTGNVEYFKLRNRLQNSRIRFEQTRKGRVVFLGGSITNMNGWRQMMCESLKKRFTNTEFDFINAGISSTDSTLGAFRLGETVFHKGQVDLLFVEHAVNDFHNSRNEIERIRGAEGVIRQALLRNPNLDIVMMHFIDPAYMPMFNRGEMPPVIASHEKITDYYGITSINLAREVTERINYGEFTWAEDFRNLHPSPFGHGVYTRSIERLLDHVWKGPLAKDARLQGAALPAEPVDEFSYFRGRYVDIGEAEILSGWMVDPAWKAKSGGTRAGFRDVPMLVAEEAGATLKLAFSGTSVGLLEVAGPDVGVIEYCVDGAQWKQLDQFTQWSGGLNIPWGYILEAELSNKNHVLMLRTTARKNDRSKGFACRIVKFLVN